jgi:hypothetical protein
MLVLLKAADMPLTGFLWRRLPPIELKDDRVEQIAATSRCVERRLVQAPACTAFWPSAWTLHMCQGPLCHALHESAFTWMPWNHLRTVLAHAPVHKLKMYCLLPAV